MHPSEKIDEISPISILNSNRTKILQKIAEYYNQDYYFEKFIPVFHQSEILDEFGLNLRNLLGNLISLKYEKSIKIHDIFGVNYLISTI